MPYDPRATRAEHTGLNYAISQQGQGDIYNRAVSIAANAMMQGATTAGGAIGRGLSDLGRGIGEGLDPTKQADAELAQRSRDLRMRQYDRQSAIDEVWRGGREMSVGDVISEHFKQDPSGLDAIPSGDLAREAVKRSLQGYQMDPSAFSEAEIGPIVQAVQAMRNERVRILPEDRELLDRAGPLPPEYGQRPDQVMDAAAHRVDATVAQYLKGPLSAKATALLSRKSSVERLREGGSPELAALVERYQVDVEDARAIKPIVTAIKQPGMDLMVTDAGVTSILDIIMSDEGVTPDQVMSLSQSTLRRPRWHAQTKGGYEFKRDMDPGLREVIKANRDNIGQADFAVHMYEVSGDMASHLDAIKTRTNKQIDAGDASPETRRLNQSVKRLLKLSDAKLKAAIYESISGQRMDLDSIGSATDVLGQAAEGSIGSDELRRLMSEVTQSNDWNAVWDTEEVKRAVRARMENSDNYTEESVSANNVFSIAIAEQATPTQIATGLNRFGQMLKDSPEYGYLFDAFQQTSMPLNDARQMTSREFDTYVTQVQSIESAVSDDGTRFRDLSLDEQRKTKQAIARQIAQNAAKWAAPMVAPSTPQNTSPTGRQLGPKRGYQQQLNDMFEHDPQVDRRSGIHKLDGFEFHYKNGEIIGAMALNEKGEPTGKMLRFMEDEPNRANRTRAYNHALYSLEDGVGLNDWRERLESYPMVKEFMSQDRGGRTLRDQIWSLRVQGDDNYGSAVMAAEIREFARKRGISPMELSKKIQQAATEVPDAPLETYAAFSDELFKTVDSPKLEQPDDRMLKEVDKRAMAQDVHAAATGSSDYDPAAEAERMSRISEASSVDPLFDNMRVPEFNVMDATGANDAMESMTGERWQPGSPLNIPALSGLREAASTYMDESIPRDQRAIEALRSGAAAYGEGALNIGHAIINTPADLSRMIPTITKTMWGSAVDRAMGQLREKDPGIEQKIQEKYGIPLRAHVEQQMLADMNEIIGTMSPQYVADKAQEMVGSAAAKVAETVDQALESDLAQQVGYDVGRAGRSVSGAVGEYGRQAEGAAMTAHNKLYGDALDAAAGAYGSARGAADELRSAVGGRVEGAKRMAEALYGEVFDLLGGKRPKKSKENIQGSPDYKPYGSEPWVDAQARAIATRRAKNRAEKALGDSIENLLASGVAPEFILETVPEWERELLQEYMVNGMSLGHLQAGEQDEYMIANRPKPKFRD